MNQFSAGQRVKLARKQPFFASEEEGQVILEQVGLVRMKEMRSEFENILKEAKVEIGSEGTVDIPYTDGYVQVSFDNTGCPIDVPLHLLEPA